MRPFSLQAAGFRYLGANGPAVPLVGLLPPGAIGAGAGIGAAGAPAGAPADGAAVCTT
jgi:hypothetical protein